MREVVDIVVPGTPVPQGSKTAYVVKGRAVMFDANKALKPWREHVARVVGEQFVLQDEPLLEGPVMVKVCFAFTRPRSHYRTGKNADLLKNDAPWWHTAPNDLDKLQRAIGDALTGVAWKDDKQVCSWSALKRYADHAYARIRIIDLSGGHLDGQRSSASSARADSGRPDHAAHPEVPRR